MSLPIPLYWYIYDAWGKRIFYIILYITFYGSFLSHSERNRNRAVTILLLWNRSYSQRVSHHRATSVACGIATLTWNRYLLCLSQAACGDHRGRRRRTTRSTKLRCRWRTCTRGRRCVCVRDVCFQIVYDYLRECVVTTNTLPSPRAFRLQRHPH